MLKHFKLPLRFDPDHLKADLQHIRPDEWTAHFNAREYEGDWGGVALRSPGGAHDRLYPDTTGTARYADTEVLARCPNITEALAAFKCPLKSVRLLRLAPGSRILEHRDFQIGYREGEVRLHVPVETNPRVEFYAAGQRLTLQEGECWYVDFSQPHRVSNFGETDRVHLVIDCVVNDWLRSIVPFEDSERTGASPATVGGDATATRESFEQFQRAVLQDPALQESLRETADKKLFIELTVRLGAERGFHFTEDDVSEAMRASRRAWLERWI